MFSFKNKKILIIAPHPDDEVIGCGGLIQRAKREGGQVYVLYLTVGTTQDFSKKGISTEKERIAEIKKVSRFLKFDGYRIAFVGNDYHLQLDALPQKNLIDEIERGKDISLEALKPSIVVAPSPNEYNQDHRAASLATISASRPTSPAFKYLVPLLLFYEDPLSTWTNQQNSHLPNFFVKLSSNDLKAKIEALNLYKSQLKDPNGPASVDGIKTLAYLRGMQTGVKMAEYYTAKRIIL